MEGFVYKLIGFSLLLNVDVLAKRYRPCPSNDIECVRQYLCGVMPNAVEGTGEGLDAVYDIPLHIEFPYFNASVDALFTLRGLSNSYVYDMYIDDKAGVTILTLQHDIEFEATESDFHLYELNQPTLNIKNLVGLYRYSPVITTSEFFGIEYLDWDKRHTYTISEDPNPYRHFGKETLAAAKKYPQLKVLFEGWVIEDYVAEPEFFDALGPMIADAFITNNLASPSYQQD